MTLLKRRNPPLVPDAACRIRAALLLLLLYGGLATAQAPAAFTHADFVTGDRSMQQLVEFPGIDDDVQVNVTCSGIATAKGRLKEALCSAPNDPDLEFTMAVSRRFNSSRMVPATVDGKAEEVDFQFVVSFSKKGDNETIAVYPNNGKNIDRLGLEYYSAQRYSPHVWPHRCGSTRREDLVLEVAIIDATGRPREVNVMTAETVLPATCKARLISQLEDGRWIPASYNGEFVESVWVSPIVLSRLSYKRQQ
ncbi:MAG: hypothetical protein KJO82_02250 [Gammaproteobacteria bacterium]|nr:hypothetical protein [Gammaproteobacteria bacterium]